MHAFATLKVDYCNELCVGLLLEIIHKLQLVQNMAAQLKMGVGCQEHITPVFQGLYWLT